MVATSKGQCGLEGPPDSEAERSRGFVPLWGTTSKILGDSKLGEGEHTTVTKIHVTPK